MTMPDRLWCYRARLERVIDGDTIVVTWDLGAGVHIGRGNEGAHLRLLDVDSPERGEMGWSIAKAFTETWLKDASATGDRWPLIIETRLKADSFGRYLANVWRTVDGESLNEAIVVRGWPV